MYRYELILFACNTFYLFKCSQSTQTLRWIYLHLYSVQALQHYQKNDQNLFKTMLLRYRVTCLGCSEMKKINKQIYLTDGCANDDDNGDDDHSFKPILSRRKYCASLQFGYKFIHVFKKDAKDTCLEEGVNTQIDQWSSKTKEELVVFGRLPHQKTIFERDKQRLSMLHTNCSVDDSPSKNSQQIGCREGNFALRTWACNSSKIVPTAKNIVSSNVFFRNQGCHQYLTPRVGKFWKTMPFSRSCGDQLHRVPIRWILTSV